MSDIIEAPRLADTRQITAKDILYTAWGRGRDGKFWMEDTEPLTETLDKLVQQSISYGVQKAVQGFAAAGIMPLNSLPCREGDRADLWIKRLGSSDPYRACDCTLHHTRYERGQPVDKLTWTSGMGDSFRRYLPEEIVGWSLIPAWKEAARG